MANLTDLVGLFDGLPVSDGLVAALIAALVALVGTARHYRRTGRLPLTRLPWRSLRRLGYAARREWFTNGRPTTLVDLGDDLETARERFAEAGFMPEWPLSYHYHGEDANLARYYYDATREFPHRQFHVRLFVEDGTAHVYAHEEPSALHHPQAHLAENDMSDATEWAATAYEQAGGDGTVGGLTALDPRLWAKGRE